VTREWGGLRGILNEARAIDDELRNKPLLDCPRCGTPLTPPRASDGCRACPMGHFQTWAKTQGELDYT
jgi:hypothetical protein